MTGTHSNLRALCWRTLSLLLPFALFVWLVLAEPPRVLVQEISARNPVILLGLWLFFFGALRLRGWAGVLASLTATLLVFGIELLSLWQSGASDGDVVIGGLLPWSDAAQYYFGAQILNEGGELDAWHGRRPWFMALLAVLLSLAQSNLQWVQAALVAMVAVACVLLLRVLRRDLGSAAAATAMLLLLLFYARFIGTTLSEHFGLALGAVALAVLWSAARACCDRVPGRVWAIGLCLLTFALLARAGAFFVLPALLCWGVWQAGRVASKREAGLVLLTGSVAIALGFVLDALLRQALVPHALPFGNFAYTLYGLVTGNRGWLQAERDHPQIGEMDEVAAAAYVYQLALQALRADPMALVQGALGAWRDFFSFHRYGLLVFIPGFEARLLACVLVALGLVHCAWRWREPPYALCLAMSAGVLLSVPFVPPVDAHAMRAYAATLPLVALLAALGVALFVRKAPASAAHGGRPGVAIVAAGYGGALIVIALAGSLLLRFGVQPASLPPVACPDGQTALQVRLSAGSALQLMEDPAALHSRSPQLRIGDFRSGAEAYRRWYPAVHAALQKLRPGQSLRAAINLSSSRRGETLWLVTDADAGPPGGVAQLCARPELVGDVRFYYVHSRAHSR